jgi:hypothetical protein
MQIDTCIWHFYRLDQPSLEKKLCPLLKSIKEINTIINYKKSTKTIRLGLISST